jgi:transposase
MVAALSGQYHLSKRQIAELLSDFFGISIGLGSVQTLEQATSEALLPPVAEVHAAVKEQAVANVDETSWREGARKGWLWVMVTPLATLFLLRLSRWAQVAKELLGEAFKGVVGSDRWSGYNWIAPGQRQVCWAHLLRDFSAFLERAGVSEQIGRSLLFEAQQMFHLWHRVRDGTFDRAPFSAAILPIQQRVGELLRRGARCDHPKTAKTCANLLKIELSLWTFVSVEGVEWIMIVVATLKQQKRNVLEYLQSVCLAQIRGEKAPSLLPNPTPESQPTV